MDIPIDEEDIIHSDINEIINNINNDLNDLIETKTDENGALMIKLSPLTNYLENLAFSPTMYEIALYCIYNNVDEYKFVTDDSKTIIDIDQVRAHSTSISIYYLPIQQIILELSVVVNNHTGNIDLARLYKINGLVRSVKNISNNMNMDF